MSNEKEINGEKEKGIPKGNAKVVIIEDQRLVADFFLLHCQTMRLNVIGVYANLAEGLAGFRVAAPDLLLLDFSLPDGSGLEAAKTILVDFPKTKILGISAHRDPWTMLQVQRIGLHGFVDKHEQRADILSEAILTVLAGRIYYVPVVNEATARLRRDPKAFIRVLSDYELRILSLIGESMSDEEIATLLNISPATMQSRRRDIMRKIDIHTTPKLIHFAIVNGLTRPDQLSQRT